MACLFTTTELYRNSINSVYKDYMKHCVTDKERVSSAMYRSVLHLILIWGLEAQVTLAHVVKQLQKLMN